MDQLSLETVTAERLVAVASAPSGSGAFECLGALTGDLKRQGRIEEDENMASTETSWRCRWGASWMGLGVRSWPKGRRLSSRGPPPRSTSPRRRDLPSTISLGEDTFVTTMGWDHLWPKKRLFLLSGQQLWKRTGHGLHVDA